MTKRLLVLAIFIIAGGLAATASAREAGPKPVETTPAARMGQPSADSPASPADLRFALAFWLPIYYGIFVWLLTRGEMGGGSKRKVDDRGPRLAAWPGLNDARLVPVRARSPRAPTRRR